MPSTTGLHGSATTLATEVNDKTPTSVANSTDRELRFGTNDRPLLLSPAMTATGCFHHLFLDIRHNIDGLVVRIAQASIEKLVRLFAEGDQVEL